MDMVDILLTRYNLECFSSFHYKTVSRSVLKLFVVASLAFYIWLVCFETKPGNGSIKLHSFTFRIKILNFPLSNSHFVRIQISPKIQENESEISHFYVSIKGTKEEEKKISVNWGLHTLYISITKINEWKVFSA